MEKLFSFGGFLHSFFLHHQTPTSFTQQITFKRFLRSSYSAVRSTPVIARRV
jgi:hypothetical protein